MTRSRKYFLFFVALFVAFLVFIVFDISRRTTPPWKKKHATTAETDTSKNRSSPKTATQQP